jgi:hypothetical protein
MKHAKCIIVSFWENGVFPDPGLLRSLPLADFSRITLTTFVERERERKEEEDFRLFLEYFFLKIMLYFVSVYFSSPKNKTLQRFLVFSKSKL